jgi:hypothetical protein
LFSGHHLQSDYAAKPRLTISVSRRFSQGATTMRKYLLTAILIAAFASPALAEEFYVGYDGKRCEMFSHKPGGKMNLIGTFKSKHDAEKAMKEMKQCNKG